MTRIRQITLGLASAALLAGISHVSAEKPHDGVTATFGGGRLMVNGDNRDNAIVISRDAAGTILVNGGAVQIKGHVPTVANTSLIQVRGRKGNDELRLDETQGALPAGQLIGDDGDDLLIGGSSADELHGGPGNDLLIGGRGDDRMFGGDGDDEFVWNPGDGTDLIEGENGNDALLFNGSNASEIVVLQADGPRFRFFRNVGAVFMDCDGIEQVTFNAVGGADRVTVGALESTQVTHVTLNLLDLSGADDGQPDTLLIDGTDGDDVIVVNDLTGTAVTEVDLDVSIGAGAGTGDGQPDTIVLNPTDDDDVVLVVGEPTGLSVLGLAAVVNVTGSEAALDQLTINTLAGDDVVEASSLPAGVIALVADGGPDDDVLIGSEGNDVLLGGEGDDVLIGGPGIDILDGGPGDNIVIQD
jgi:Ca2+-binding RTX toxin-like protein